MKSHPEKFLSPRDDLIKLMIRHHYSMREVASYLHVKEIRLYMMITGRIFFPVNIESSLRKLLKSGKSSRPYKEQRKLKSYIKSRGLSVKKLAGIIGYPRIELERILDGYLSMDDNFPAFIDAQISNYLNPAPRVPMIRDPEEQYLYFCKTHNLEPTPSLGGEEEPCRLSSETLPQDSLIEAPVSSFTTTGIARSSLMKKQEPDTTIERISFDPVTGATIIH
jgi:plasmid maintenance system antidote protein VapI